MHQINIKIKCYRSSDVVSGPDWKYQYSIVIKMRPVIAERVSGTVDDEDTD